jgi:hypothetical protein
MLLIIHYEEIVSLFILVAYEFLFLSIQCSICSLPECLMVLTILYQWSIYFYIFGRKTL